MIQKKISGDITKMESKILFGYTPRQVVCSIVAFIMALLINKILCATNNNDCIVIAND